MAKHKKTKQQKIITELRRKLQPTVENKQASNATAQSSEDVQVSKTINYVPSITKRETHKPNLANTYSYVTDDLKKTVILTVSIIITQVALFFLLKTNIITLPMFKY